MVEAVISAFSLRDQLREHDLQILRSLQVNRRSLHRHQEIAQPGAWPTESLLVLSGVAAHEIQTRDGARQFTAIYLPGEFLNLHSLVTKQIEYGVVAMTPCELVVLPHSELEKLIASSAHLARLILLQMAVEGAIQRAALASMGRVAAWVRLGRFYCEVYLRLRLTGNASDNRFVLDLTQSQVADVLGMSLVHVNRSLRRLREVGLIRTEGRTVIIENWEALIHACEYDGTYLSLMRAPR